MNLFPDDTYEVYWTGTRQQLVLGHERRECASRGYGCPVHAPSEHPMRDFPTHWRNDRGLMERICPHGVGHPDPDHVAHTLATRGATTAAVEAVHGCDGCCDGVEYPHVPRD